MKIKLPKLIKTKITSQLIALLLLTSPILGMHSEYIESLEDKILVKKFTSSRRMWEAAWGPENKLITFKRTPKNKRTKIRNI